MNNLLESAINAIQRSEKAWCRYITANDTGQTGGHQSGFYVPKCAAPLLFDELGRKGENKEKTVSILWQDDFYTTSRMKYYGQGTRNEYRITRFGRDFPFLNDEYIGSLLILSKMTDSDYVAYVLSSDDDIDGFYAYFNLSPNETNQLITAGGTDPDKKLEMFFQEHVRELDDFPTTLQMSSLAQLNFNKAHSISKSDFIKSPDSLLLSWLDAEYRLFRLIEEKIYSGKLKNAFESVDEFVRIANEVLNRRKSRAGKSLEHHLSELFSKNDLVFEEQALTEGKKRPDFLFPNSSCYHNFEFPAEDLVVLGAKTTCKDRWRQVLSEADRVEEKYLFTLQQGISLSQLKEMSDAKLTLIVPKPYIQSFPKAYQNQLKDLSEFIGIVKRRQDNIPKHYLI
ncbi:type II restriction endonuclease [Duncaniella muris]|uniref:type II restriction endonuclease n=1 Tax=Duncaniella muris TaxID=2094150 RepID=UPI00272D7BF9|nr:type II restriction endonuclease [Duncaniella muris]